MLKDDEQSEILIKVIQTNDEEVAGEIIDATNSQTAVSPISLHSNEMIQKNIEEHFAKYNKMPLFYERRINYYRRRNKPNNRIVTMMKVFQVFYSTFEKKPSVARGRPTESFERNYTSVFNTDFDYDTYLYTYLMYLKMSTINREAKKTENKDYIWFLVRQYGIFHILRIAFALFIGNDYKINLKDKENIFIKRKKELETIINDEKAINDSYFRSAEILRKCIADFKKKDKTAVLSYSLLKNEDLDKKISRELYKMLDSKK